MASRTRLSLYESGSLQSPADSSAIDASFRRWTAVSRNASASTVTICPPRLRADGPTGACGHRAPEVRAVDRRAREVGIGDDRHRLAGLEDQRARDAEPRAVAESRVGLDPHETVFHPIDFVSAPVATNLCMTKSPFVSAAPAVTR